MCRATRETAGLSPRTLADTLLPPPPRLFEEPNVNVNANAVVDRWLAFGGASEKALLRIAPVTMMRAKARSKESRIARSVAVDGKDDGGGEEGTERRQLAVAGARRRGSCCYIHLLLFIP
jgi:hypothetical protein